MKKTALVLTLALASMCGVTAQEPRITNTPEQEFEKGKELFLEKQYAISNKHFEKYLSQQNGNNICELCQESEYYIAVNAFMLKDKNAKNILEEYLEKYPYSPMNHYVNYYIGRINYEKKRYDKALKYYEQVDERKLSEEDAQDYVFAKSYCYLMKKDYKNASRNFATLTGVNQKYTYDAEYYHAYSEFCMKNYKEALETFINVKGNSNYYEASMFHALQIYDQLHYRTKAVELGKKLIEKYPESKYLSEAYRILGENSYFKQNWNDVTTYLNLYANGQKKLHRADMYMLGIADYMNSDFEKAINALGKVTTEKDSLAQNAYIFIGHAHLEMNEADKARMAFQNASMIDSDSKLQEESLYNYALATYESKAPFGEMIKTFERFINEYPNSEHLDDVYEHMVNVYLTDKNYAGAVESINKVTEPSEKLMQAKEHALFHLGVDAYKTKQLERAADLFQQSIKASSGKSFSAQAYLWLGDTYYLKGNGVEARKQINKFLSTKQKKTAEQIQKAYYTLAYTYFDEKEYDNALLYFRSFGEIVDAKHSPVYNDVLNRLGDCYFHQRELNLARKTYNLVDSESSVADYAKFQDAFILGLQKQYDAKIKALNSLLVKYPNSEFGDNAIYEIGRTYVLQDKHKEAIGCYKKLQAMFPQSALTRKASLEIGMQYANMNKNDKAIEAYKYVISQYPASEETRVAMESLQSIYVDENRVDEYLAYRESLKGSTISTVAKSQEDSISFIAAERVYARGNYKEAIESLDKYILKYCDNQTLNCITAQYYLAESLYNTGETMRALTYYDKLTALDGSNYLEPALLRASAITYDNKDYATAKKYFDKLYLHANKAENKEIARLGILRCGHFTADYDATIKVASEIIGDNKTDEATKREAHYCRAKSFIAINETDKAVEDLTAISNNISYEMGAEAKYLYAQYLYEEKEFKASEETIMEFIKEGTTYQYWLARCFVLLSDIYTAQGDDFMAKQYLISLQENYTGEDDIEEMINNRLEKITARESEEILN